jgi:endonuclease YncB( thermonuclease family)
MKFFALILALLVVVAPAAEAHPVDTLEGRVVEVVNGDTVIVLGSHGEREEIRLAGIFAPKKAQPYAEEAKKMLSDLVYNQPVSVDIVAAGRSIQATGYLFKGADLLDINAEMVKRGGAYAIRGSGQQIEYLRDDEQAQDQRRGLWALSEPYKGQLSFHRCGATTTFNGLPRFENYPAEHPARKIAKDIDWGSSKDAWAFRTRLRAGLKAGPNFNGHYSVVEFGCGSSCHVQMIIDVDNGKVLDSLKAGATYGVTYRLSSALIAADLPDPDVEWRDYSYLRYGGPRFFQVKNARVIHIKDVDVSSVEESGYFPCVEGHGKRRRWVTPEPISRPLNNGN